MRTSEQMRSTKETCITIRLNLDGGNAAIETGIGFFDHMLEAFAVHGGFGLEVTVKGDLQVDCHHTIEDTGIVLGRAFCEALGNKSGIARYGSFLLPMDETLAWMSAGGRISFSTRASRRSVSAGLTPACAGNFSALLP